MNEQVYKILFICDSEAVRAMFRYYLDKNQESRYEFLEAELSGEGIEICQKEKPACVLLDYKQPNADGSNLLKAINPDPLNPEFPIVLFTDPSSEMTTVNALKIGAHDYLIKGKITPDDLHITIQKAIETVQLRKEKNHVMGELQKSEEFLKIGIEVADFSVVQIDYPNNTAHFTADGARLFGLGDEETIVPRERVHATFHPDEKEKLEELIAKSLDPNGDGWFNLEHRVVLENGDVRWLNVRKQIFFDRQANPPHATHGILAAQNITERKAAAEKLAVSEKFLQGTIDALTAHIAILDKNGVIVSVNEAWRKFAVENDFAADNYGIGQRYFDTYDPPNTEEFDRHADRATEGLRLVSSGELDSFFLEYPCDTKTEKCWFIMRVTRFDLTGGDLRVVVAHENITTRKIAEEKLRASEERLSLAMKGAQIGSFDWNLKTDTIVWSREIENAAEMSPDDFDNSFKGLINHIHPLDREILQNRIEEGIKTGEYECEFRMLKGDGTIRWVLGKGRVFYDEAGAPERLLGVDIDITKRKIAEEELRENQRFTESIIETAPNVLYIFNLKTLKTTFFTKQMANSLGYEFDEMKEFQDKIFESSIHPDDLQSALKHFENIKETGGNDIFEFEYRMRHKSGEWRWFRSRDMIFKHDENGGAEEILGVALDITERRLAEERLQRSQLQTQLALDAGKTIAFTWDIENDRVQRMHSNFEILPITDNDTLSGVVEQIYEEDREKFSANLRDAMARPQEPYVAEYRIQTNDEIKWLTETGRFILDENGSPIQLTGISADITERKKFAEQLQRNHETFFNLVQNTPFGTYIVDSDFRLMQISKGSQKVFSGIESPIGRDFAEILRTLWEEPFASEAIGRFRHTLETGEAYRSTDTTEQRSDTEDVESYDWKIERITLPDGQFGVVCYFYDLTERLQFEAKMRESEQRMRLVLNAAKVGIWIYDLVGETIYWSPEHYEIFGTKTFDGTLENFKKFVHPEDVEIILNQFQNSVEKGEPYQPEFRIVRPDGEIRWVTNLGHVEYDADGKPHRFLGTVFDITERKRTELNLAFLADLQQRFSVLSSPEKIMQTAGKQIAEYLGLTHCLFVEINEALDEAAVIHDEKTADAQSLLGVYKLDDFHSETERKMFSAGKAIVFNDTKSDLGLEEGFSKFENLGIRSFINAPYVSNGRWRFVLSAMHSQPHLWRKDELELLQELSARICLRLERARSEEALRDSEEKYRALFDSIDEGFCIIEMIFDENEKPTDYRFVQVNPAMERLTGLKDALGKTARELVPDLEDFWFETYGNAALTGEAIHFENKSEPLKRWFSVSAKRIGGESSRLVAIVFDNITERKIAEIEKEKMLENEQILRREAEAANRAREDFLAMLSHELRTPLNAMYGWTQILQSKDYDRDVTKKGIEIIARNVQLQNALIEDLLDVSRIISGKMRLEPAKFSLGSIILSAVEAARPNAEQRLIEMSVNLKANCENYFGDKYRIEQVINNLLTNAVKFTPEKGVVNVSLECRDNTAILTVRDNGIGISPELLPQIFDRFRQADNSTKRQFGGLGLGLTIIKNLTELHGGKVFAYSEGENKGSTFIVELPLIDPACVSARNESVFR